MKRLFSAILILICNFFAFVPIYAITVDGIQYYILEDNTAVVQHKMVNWVNSFYSGDIVIPSSFIYEDVEYTVTGISDYAFGDCSNLTSVVIPNTVTSIGSYAFKDCSSLPSILVAPDNEYYSSVDGVLYNADQTTLICYPAGKQNSFSIPNSVVCIDGFAFSGCENLTSIELPNSITSIGDNAFYGCKNLTSIELPNSITSIGFYAFEKCASLASISVAAGNDYYSSIDGVLYNADQTSIICCPGGKQGSFIIPNTITSIEGYFDCSLLNSIVIPESVTSIYNYAFENCSSLTSISVASGNNYYSSVDGVLFNKDLSSLLFCPAGRQGTLSIPYTVTHINYGALNCPNLTAIEIPGSLTNIDQNVFSGCNNVETLIYAEDCTTALRTYLTSIKSVIFPNTLTSISDNAFYRCSNLTTVEIPSSLQTIGSRAFSGCNNVETLIYAEGCTKTIRTGLSSIKTVVLPNTLECIGDYTFSDCSNLTSIDIPNSVTSIGMGVFASCYDLTSITIPNSVTSIGDFAFNGCSNLTSISIPNSVTSIGNYAFSASGLTSIDIPNSITSISEYLFEGCNKLISISIPNSVTSIGNQAFRGCFSLSEMICYAKKMPVVNGNIFENTAYTTGTLYVPDESLSKYESAFPWYGWGSIKSINDLENEGKQKCQTPVIMNEDGKISFGCETPGAECHYTLSMTDVTEVEKTISAPTQFTLTVYATAEGYLQSDEATCTISVGPKGDVNGDNAVNVADIIELQNIILGSE